MLTPILKDSEKMADTDYAKVKFDQTLHLALSNFKLKYQREASVHETQLLQQMVTAKLSHDHEVELE